MHRANREEGTARESTVRRVALAACAASSIEWYDFFIYGTAAALVFGPLFFPDFSPLAGTLAAFATFAVGFVARPVGGVLFGHFGDGLGRKPTLIIALLTMGMATMLIGLMPTYETIGVAAPIGLVALRFVQGLAVGGQWGGAMLLATEYAPDNKRGFYGSFAQVGVPVGLLLGNVAFLALSSGLSEEAFVAWGWRVPFLLSIVLIGLAFYIQLRIEDTPAFRRLQEFKEENERALAEHVAAGGRESVEKAQSQTEAERRPSPVLEAFRTYPKQIALTAGAFVAINANFYILTTFIVAYGTNPAVLGLSQSTMLAAVLISSVFMIVALLAAGSASDRMGRRGLYMLGAVFLGVWSFVLWPLIDTGSFLLIVVALVLGQVFLGMMYGPQAAFYSETFSTRVRYSGASMGYQIGSIFGGALAPFISTALLAQFGSPMAIAVYMAVLCAVTFLSVFLLTETYGKNMVEDAETEQALG